MPPELRFGIERIARNSNCHSVEPCLLLTISMFLIDLGYYDFIFAYILFLSTKLKVFYSLVVYGLLWQ